MLPGGAINRRYYELCVLSELRDRLRAGDVWVVGSRRYRSFEERLISRETQQELQQSAGKVITFGIYLASAARFAIRTTDASISGLPRTDRPTRERVR